MIELLKQWDTDLFLFLNGMHTPFGDVVMFYCSEKLTWIPLYIFILYLCIRFFKWKTLWILLAVTMLITISDQLSVHGFKNVFMRLRPCHEPLLDGLVHTVNNKCGGQYGFVSSHAINHFALASFLAILFKNRISYFAPLIIIWALVVSYSRIYLGVHYPGDVICGGILGVFLGILMAKIFQVLLLKKINLLKKR